MPAFSQKIFKVGINPCVVPPQDVLEALFRQSRKNKGPIPVRGRINDARFTQTLVKFRGKWRLYINTSMLRASGLKNGDLAQVEIEYDPSDRTIPIHPALAKALATRKKAEKAYEKLAPHRKKEINRYLHNLKTREAVERSVGHIVTHLLGRKPEGLHALLRIEV